MPTLNAQADVSADVREHVTIWRLLEHAGSPEPVAVASGIVEYPQPQGDADPEMRGSHEFSEFYYVIDGTGVVADEESRVELKPGDAFRVAGGLRHTLWATTEQPLKCFYVALLEKAD